MKLTTAAATGLAVLGAGGALAAFGACGDDVTTGPGGSGGTGSATTSSTNQGGGGAAQGGASQGGGAATQGGGGAGQGGAPTVCGGLAQLQCASTDWCNYQPSQCGGDDSTGVCELKPNACDDIYQPVCACDGNVHGNECDAQLAGVDLNLLGGCEPPDPQLFSCGAWFCSRAADYCRRSISDVVGMDDDFVCVAQPVGCGNVATCDCLGDEPCGTECAGEPDTGLTVTCPGG
jgi:hypothetical protein